MSSREARYRVMFDLAWDGKGLIIDLAKVPDHILNLMVNWRNAKVEAENEAFDR